MEDKDTDDCTNIVRDKLTKPTVVEEMQCEPANTAHKLEEEENPDNKSANTRSEKVPNTQESKSDEGQDEFYDAENVIIQGSQEQKEKLASDDSEVDEVFMDLDDPDRSMKTSQNEQLDESVIELDQTELKENILSQTNEIVSSNLEGSVATAEKSDQTENLQAEIDAQSSILEEDLTEDLIKLNESECTEDSSQIVISDVSTATEEAELEMSNIEDKSIDTDDNSKLQAEGVVMNDSVTCKMLEEENSISDKRKDEKINNYSVGTESDELEQTEENPTHAILPQTEYEKEALPLALETVEVEAANEKEAADKTDDLQQENKKDTQPLLSQNDELRPEREEAKQIASEIEFEEDSLAESFANKLKYENKSKLNESLDLFASESDDLENLTGAQSVTPPEDNDVEPVEATLLDSQGIELTEKMAVKEPEMHYIENEIVKVIAETVIESLEPSVEKAVVNLELVGVENDPKYLENKNLQKRVSLEPNTTTEIENDTLEAENTMQENKDPVITLKSDDTDSSKDQDSVVAENKKVAEVDIQNVESDKNSDIIVLDNDVIEIDQLDANKNMPDESKKEAKENTDLTDAATAAQNIERQTESKINSRTETPNSQVEDENFMASAKMLLPAVKILAEQKNKVKEVIAENKNSAKDVALEPIEVDRREEAENVKECNNMNNSTNTASKEIYVFQQKIDADKLKKILPKDNEISVIEIDDDDDLPKAANNVNNVHKPSASSAAEYGKNNCHKKQCINVDCTNAQRDYYRATLAVLQFYKIDKKINKKQFVCETCYEKAINKYEEYIDVLRNKMPLYSHKDLEKIRDAVEIIESSDEEDNVQEVITKSVPGDFSISTLDLIEHELQNTMRDVFDMVDIQNQLKWCKALQDIRLKRLDKQNEEHTVELDRIQQEVDAMQTAIYQYPKVTIRALQPLDLNASTDIDLCYYVDDSTGETTKTAQHNLPPIGEIVRPPIVVNGMYYAVKNKPIASWVPCTVLEQVENKSIPLYKIKYIYSHHQMVKTVTSKYLAYYKEPDVRLPIGSRVIAYFDVGQLQRGREKAVSVHSAFYPGIIAEPMRVNNKYRYLIFYDDGYTQYVKHEHVRLVCNVSDNVWEDIHPNSREFIKKYLMQYAINRPMVQTQKGQTMQTESDGKWMYARVIDIDCSLVQMQFEGPKTHTEWIYRGSARLGPVFKEFQKNKDSSTFSRLTRRTEPFIRYTIDEETTMQQQREEQQKLKVQQQQQQQQQQLILQQQQQQQQLEQKKQQLQIQRPPTAKKSTSLPQQQQQSTNRTQTVRHLNNSTIYLEDDTVPKGKTIFYMTKRDLPPTKYTKHKCNRSCRTKVSHSLAVFNPLSKPLITGWERLLMRQKSKIVVVYRGPCGKIMRNIKEVHTYLRATDCIWNVEHFDFSSEINCLAEFVIESPKLKKPDISMGKEKMPIPLVNCYDNTLPPECEYSAQRIPTEGVNLNLDEEFLVGCDCEDDCSDKSKCSCWKLTLAGAKYGNPNTPIDEVGYQYKRLYEHVPTGIYECNSRCKCKSSCLNRVVQQSLQLKLEVFKTSNRGWGLRCINDVPRGSFVCIYAGHLLTEAKANEGGLDAGDEYFAELDYIEVAEQIKEGYENEAESIDPEEEEEEIFVPDGDDDDEFRPSKSFVKRLRNKARSIRQIDDDSLERQVINFNPNADMSVNSLRESSMRSLFGKDEACYIMDAKITGNLGRYFNHSCAPNLFVQNVFVDTHDLRFPWVAFFASSNIRSGTELTWNYNYEVGVVPGKVLYCQCGATNCRVRLL